MEKPAVLDSIPQSTLNPLLSHAEFHKLCARRFRGFPTLNAFKKWIADWEEATILRPAYIHTHEDSPISFYSTFQIWQISQLWRRKISKAKHLEGRFREFEKVLQLLVEVQDYYLPLVRTDRRVGEVRDYDAIALAGGFSMCKTSQFLLSSIQRHRRKALSSRQLDPQTTALKADLSPLELRSWAHDLVLQTRFWDPLKDWRLLLSLSSYPMRQKLCWEALLAEDYYEIALMLWAFVEDLEPVGFQDVVWPGDTLPPAGSSAHAAWLQRQYGEALGRPYEMLEFLTNKYALNPKPRAIVFTEGEEWVALESLYEHYHFSPRLLGIEFRSIAGEGRFKLANWQCFIEYMHEKQVLIYFLVDDEGETARQAERLLRRKRDFRFPHLKKVIPARDRIVIWSGSFEEANFTDAAIVRCMGRQGHLVSVDDVAAVRERENKHKALVSELAARNGLRVDKRKLALDLAADLIALRRRRPDVSKLRPVEDFVKRSGELIMLNHQPTMEESKVRNLQTGLLG